MRTVGRVRVAAFALTMFFVSALAMSPSGPLRNPQTSYGNVGDPYAGVARDAESIALSSCGTLRGGRSYRLTRDVSSRAVCFVVAGPGVKLDIGGYAISGKIVSIYEDSAPDGLTIFNGRVTCDDPRGACIQVDADESPLPLGLVFHHLTLTNLALTGSALSVNWDGTGSGVRVHHVTARAQPGSIFNRSRSDLLSVSGRGKQTAEFSFNELTCPDTRSCEAIICYALYSCRVHHNRVVMAGNTTDEPGRAILIDGGTSGVSHPLNRFADVYNNDVTANNCRALRVRNATNTRIHDNVVRSIRKFGENYTAALHWGDPDTGSVDLGIDAYNNTFEVFGGTVLMIRNGYNAILRDSKVIGTSGLLANVRSGGGITRLMLLRNGNDLPAAQVLTEPGTSTTLCNSGRAVGEGAFTHPSC